MYAQQGVGEKTKNRKKIVTRETLCCESVCEIVMSLAVKFKQLFSITSWRSWGDLMPCRKMNNFLESLN